ncbi:hypothetical protein PF005_g15430 [Phytophthora fragariae]|uniref:Uncharacterized protein n=1 Tax=Phytophthora fragariae TaxID=53985 RepID=A0A6A3RM03_9STRA|nr:hypothetical protein PF003_g36045 [Phytophthora fragariae]KAE8933262.1 hypothetical protein PF009_g16723 [Phytophthora fragariae]KAE9099375.1 hypothetical protein PF007_g15903 [Phytophthora fragariae]KAE9135503.1 hypothetical protein PF006_g14586 [Phytophthora fragariae]KAE9200220.1 hypothetical protein PF005_g15430 [Phytophthora fragariae]
MLWSYWLYSSSRFLYSRDHSSAGAGTGASAASGAGAASGSAATAGSAAAARIRAISWHRCDLVIKVERQLKCNKTS